MSVASPSRAAFPGSQAGRHPRLHFRGLLRLHSNYGPLDRSTAQGGLCHRASIHPVTRTNRLPATRSNRQLSGWFLPPLVIRAFWAHRDIPSVKLTKRSRASERCSSDNSSYPGKSRTKRFDACERVARFGSSIGTPLTRSFLTTNQSGKSLAALTSQNTGLNSKSALPRGARNSREVSASFKQREKNSLSVSLNSDTCDVKRDA